MVTSMFALRSEFPMILVANKADLESERVVSPAGMWGFVKGSCVCVCVVVGLA